MPKPFSALFPVNKPVIAMIHTGPTPGLPDCACVASAVERAIAEAELYDDYGVNGILIENMRDFPCIHERDMGPEVASFMTRIAYCVKRQVPHLPIGIQVLFQGNRTALAAALAADCDFIRAEGWTYAHISDKGIAEASAGHVHRYRHAICADHIPIYADIKKKHAAHAITGDVPIEVMARTFELSRADGVVITGASTGVPPSIDEVVRVREATSLPLLVGSGVNEENFLELADVADGFIIGSALKEGGVWHAPVCEDRLKRVMSRVNEARVSVSAVAGEKALT